MLCSRVSITVALAVTLALPSGCAQIVSSSTVEILPRPEASSLVLGSPGGEITARGVAVRWTQAGDRLSLRLDEIRACETVRHIPVMRVERIHRKTARGAMWWEYGLGAGALAVGLVGLIRPESFSQTTIVNDGVEIRDTATGYRVGGILTGLGVLLLTAAVVDTVRTRDEVLYTDAYRREQGGAVPCTYPVVPLAAHDVELLVGEWTDIEPTNGDGEVRFLLPELDQLPEEAQAVVEAYEAWQVQKAEADAAAARAAEAAEAKAEAEAAEAAKGKRRRRRGSKASREDSKAEEVAIEIPEVGPPPEPVIVRGVVRVDDARALAIDFVVPYGIEAADGHHGQVEIEPGPAISPPPRPRVNKKPAGDATTTDPESGAESDAESGEAVDGSRESDEVPEAEPEGG